MRFQRRLHAAADGDDMPMRAVNGRLVTCENADHDSNSRLRAATVNPVRADSSRKVSIGLLSYMRLMSAFDMVYP